MDGTDLVWAAAEDARSAAVVFLSPRLGRRYRIGNVAADRMIVDRLDGREAQTFMRTEVRDGLLRLEQAGGRVRRRQLFRRVAKEAALVHLHPELRWSEDGQWIEQVKSAKPAVLRIYWIVQGTPDRYELDAYLSRASRIYWTIRYASHRNEMRAGDRVFVWRASGKRRLTAGVVAAGTITEPATRRAEVRHPEHLRDDLWLEGGPEGEGWCVGIHLDAVRLTPEEGMLTRRLVERDTVLSSLAVVTRRVGTSFRVPPGAGERLDDLWRAGGPEDRLDEASIVLVPGYTAAEGRLLERLHRFRERDPKLVALAKARFLALHGRLFCEVCGFCFAEQYGPAGEDFIEAHHVVPVAEMKPGHKTAVQELAMLCANCHRMAHRPSFTLDQLRAMRAAAAAIPRP